MYNNIAIHYNRACCTATLLVGCLTTEPGQQLGLYTGACCAVATVVGFLKCYTCATARVQ